MPFRMVLKIRLELGVMSSINMHLTVPKAKSSLLYKSKPILTLKYKLNCKYVHSCIVYKKEK